MFEGLLRKNQLVPHVPRRTGVTSWETRGMGSSWPHGETALPSFTASQGAALSDWLYSVSLGNYCPAVKGNLSTSQLTQEFLPPSELMAWLDRTRALVQVHLFLSKCFQFNC